jgi:hypothetical protein
VKVGEKVRVKLGEPRQSDKEHPPCPRQKVKIWVKEWVKVWVKESSV